MQYGEFISFSATTVFEQIKSNDFQVSEELLQPFLICKSDYNMQSFSKEENKAAAIALSEIFFKFGGGYTANVFLHLTITHNRHIPPSNYPTI